MMRRSKSRNRTFSVVTNYDIDRFSKKRTFQEQVDRICFQRKSLSKNWKRYTKRCKQEKKEVCQQTFVVYMLMMGKHNKLIKSFTPKNVIRRIHNIEVNGNDAHPQQYQHWNSPLTLLRSIEYILENPPVPGTDGYVRTYVQDAYRYGEFFKRMSTNLNLSVTGSEIQHLLHKVRRILSYYSQDALNGTRLHTCHQRRS